MKARRLIVTACFLMLVISCRTQKKVESSKSQFESSITADTTVKKYEHINAEWSRVNESLIRRDGLLTIRFDSLTSISILPDRTIQAIGRNPVIESRTVDTEQSKSSDSLSFTKTDSTQSTGSKRNEASGSEERFSKEVERTPSLTPWIGGGIAIAILVLAVLWFISKKLKI
jgi:hypothetical protein